MKTVVLPIITILLTAHTANAESIALDCRGNLVFSENVKSQKLTVFFHIEIDDNGLAFTSFGETQYYTNEGDKFFRKNDYEITWGSKAFASVTGTHVINRSTGKYVNSMEGPGGRTVWDEGECALGTTRAIPKKF